MSQEDKENILRTIYYNEDGFGSINDTYKQAKKQLNSITIEDTKQWLEKNRKDDKLNHIKVLIVMLLMSLWKKYKLVWLTSPEALLVKPAKSICISSKGSSAT